MRKVFEIFEHILYDRIMQFGKLMRFWFLGQIKKIPVFRVTLPYLKLLVKPRFFFQVFWEKIVKTNMCAYPYT